MILDSRIFPFSRPDPRDPERKRIAWWFHFEEARQKYELHVADNERWIIIDLPKSVLEDFQAMPRWNG